MSKNIDCPYHTNGSIPSGYRRQGKERRIALPPVKTLQHTSSYSFATEEIHYWREQGPRLDTDTENKL